MAGVWSVIFMTIVMQQQYTRVFWWYRCWRSLKFCFTDIFGYLLCTSTGNSCNNNYTIEFSFSMKYSFASCVGGNKSLRKGIRPLVWIRQPTDHYSVQHVSGMYETIHNLYLKTICLSPAEMTITSLVPRHTCTCTFFTATIGQWGCVIIMYTAALLL